MTKKEIFDTERDNRDRIYLYLEGSFWKAYEKSAFRFVKEVKPYKTKKKYVKTIGQEMVALGFPDFHLAEVNKMLSLLESSEAVRVYKAPRADTPDEFARWKDAIALAAAKPAASDDESGRSVPNRHDGALPVPNRNDSVRPDPKSNEPQQPEPINEPLKPVAHEDLTPEPDIISMLKGFNIESKTPMECMLFLSKLKNRIM